MKRVTRGLHQRRAICILALLMATTSAYSNEPDFTLTGTSLLGLMLDIDVISGEADIVGPIPLIIGIDYRRDGQLFGAGDTLYTVNPFDATTNVIGPLPELMSSISFSPADELFSLNTSGDILFEIDPETGEEVFSVPITGTVLPPFGAPFPNEIRSIEFGPDGTLYGVGFSLYEIDIATGIATRTTPLHRNISGLIGEDLYLMIGLDYGSDGLLWANGITSDGDGLMDSTNLYTVNIATGIGSYSSSTERLKIFDIASPDLRRLIHAGDADQDYDFDQMDLVQVQIAGKYRSGQSATWGEGDWNCAPGGVAGNPPECDGVFDQLDIIAALASGTYLTGPQASSRPIAFQSADRQTSVGYDANTGELWLDVSPDQQLTSINVRSNAGIFTTASAQNLGGVFDNDTSINIFKATFGSSFGSLSFGEVARRGLSEEFVLNDLSVSGSLQGGGDLGAIDLIYVPEPSSVLLLAGGMFLVACRRWARPPSSV